jgi:putative ABC transport system ATP-binding protein
VARRAIADCRDAAKRRTMSTVVVVDDATRRYRVGERDVDALRGVSLTVTAGEYVAIVGPSGSGKSTLLTLMGGLDAPTHGTVRLLGHDVARMSDRALTRLRLEQVGFVFQRFHLLPVLTASENIALPMAERGMPRRERMARTRQLLEYVGLPDRADHRATQLSGGEMQRVAIARALANRPALVLADEPTGELDAATSRDVLELLRRLNRDGVTVIVVTHDDQLAAQASRTVHMLDGRIAP